MVDDQIEIPLCQILEAGSFWEYLPELCVGVLNASFLTTAHGITIKDPGSFTTVKTGFQCLRIAKLCAAVSKDRFEKNAEIHRSQAILQTIKHCAHGAFCASVQKICQEQFLIAEVKGQNTLLGVP